MDTLEGMVSAWIVALNAGKRWDENDAQRYAYGFDRLMQSAKRWPSPSDFLDQVSRAERDNVVKIVTRRIARETSSDETAQAHIDKITALLGIKLGDEEERSDYCQATERPWGVDICDWHPEDLQP
jgi:hypothetical protein